MEEFTDPSSGDLIREALIIIVGLIFRFIEKRKAKKQPLPTAE
jgi:hypothetical protein